MNLSVEPTFSDLSLIAVPRATVGNGVRSREEFHARLARERSCSDRNEHEFSLLAFHEKTGAAEAEHLLHVLTRRVRQIDEIGWLDPQRIGVLLPYTSSSGAKTLAEDICRMMAGSPPKYTIYTYPGPGFPAEGGKPPGVSNAMRSSASPAEGSSAAQASPKETSVRCSDWSDGLFADRIPVWKRAIDIVGAVVGLVCLSPLLLLTAIVIKTVSPGPAFLRQKRPGRHGKMFTIWKFRTMRVDADVTAHENHLNNLITGDSPLTKLDAKRDPRIFPFGRIIRRCYIDELPQLINVLCGEMSLVGPRPCMPYEVQEYKLWQTRRFDAVPGMTGLWQVSGKNKTTYKEMIRLDITYARRSSFLLDVRILLKTVPSIVGEIIDALPRRQVSGTLPERH